MECVTGSWRGDSLPPGHGQGVLEQSTEPLKLLQGRRTMLDPALAPKLHVCAVCVKRGSAKDTFRTVSYLVWTDKKRSHLK